MAERKDQLTKERQERMMHLIARGDFFEEVLIRLVRTGVLDHKQVNDVMSQMGRDEFLTKEARYEALQLGITEDIRRRLVSNICNDMPMVFYMKVMGEGTK